MSKCEGCGFDIERKDIFQILLEDNSLRNVIPEKSCEGCGRILIASFGPLPAVNKVVITEKIK